MSKHPLIQCREIYRMSSITNNTVRKYVLTSHQRVQSSELVLNRKQNAFQTHLNRENDLILIMTPEKQGKSLEFSKHWSVDSTPARNEMIMNRTYLVKSVKCDKICSNY